MGTSFITYNQNMDKHPETGKPYVKPYKLKWFRNTKFRQAVAHSIDREGIIKTVYNGLGQPQYGPMNESAGYFNNPNKKPYEYDLVEAKAMLAEMGLKDRDGDGKMEDEQGNATRLMVSDYFDEQPRVEHWRFSKGPAPENVEPFAVPTYSFV